MSPVSQPVSIVLATYNGAAFLAAQLHSILAQDISSWSVILSDDGSQDATLSIARAMIPSRRLRVLQGPALGLAQNFWNGLMQVPAGHYAAFCDQDDVWSNAKLSRALNRLDGIETAALYSAGRYITDRELNVSAIQRRTPTKGFARTVWRNRIAGHTCVLNPRAVQTLKRFFPPATVPFHDWWAALVLSGVGACFVHDPKPVLSYRQHDHNRIGANGGRLRLMCDGTYLRWVHANLCALDDYSDHLTPQARNTLRICLPLRTGLNQT